MKKKILFLVTVLAFMVAMPIASAEVLEAKDVTTLVEMVKKYCGHVYKAHYADSLGFPVSLLYRVLSPKLKPISPDSVKKYDTLVFPLSQEIDALSIALGICAT